MDKYDVPAFQEQNTRAMMLQVISTLRANPAQYQKVRDQIMTANSDSERVEAVLNLATSDSDLAALIPVRSGGVEVAAWTTVTVTTIFILTDSAY